MPRPREHARQHVEGARLVIGSEFELIGALARDDLRPVDVVGQCDRAEGDNGRRLRRRVSAAGAGAAEACTGWWAAIPRSRRGRAPAGGRRPRMMMTMRASWTSGAGLPTMSAFGFFSRKSASVRSRRGRRQLLQQPRQVVAQRQSPAPPRAGRLHRRTGALERDAGGLRRALQAFEQRLDLAQALDALLRTRTRAVGPPAARCRGGRRPARRAPCQACRESVHLVGQHLDVRRHGRNYGYVVLVGQSRLGRVRKNLERYDHLPCQRLPDCSWPRSPYSTHLAMRWLAIAASRGFSLDRPALRLGLMVTGIRIVEFDRSARDGRP